jgi:hypothetical protein
MEERAVTARRASSKCMGGVECRSIFLNIGTTWREWPASSSGRFSSEEAAPLHAVYEAEWSPESL